MGRYAVIGCALEDEQLADLRRDGGDRLDAGRTGSNNADPLAGEVDVFGPGRGAEGQALEGSGARNVGRLGRGQTAGRHDTIACLYGLALVRCDPP